MNLLKENCFKEKSVSQQQERWYQHIAEWLEKVGSPGATARGESSSRREGSIISNCRCPFSFKEGIGNFLHITPIPPEWDFCSVRVEVVLVLRPPGSQPGKAEGWER